MLKLNCDKALIYLKWQANLEYEDTIMFTSEWYFNFYNNRQSINHFTNYQIEEYVRIAEQKKIKWTE